MQAANAILSLKHVSKRYPGRNGVLRDVCLDVHDGSLSAIVGASGSGKSTLLSIMGLLDRCSSGEVILEGKNVVELSHGETAHARNQIYGFVFQAFHLLPRLNALDNVGLPLQYRGLERAARRECAQRQLEMVGLSGRELSYPNELSGGEQQRVAIARALVGEPRIVLADEPTGNLDHENSDRIFRLIKRINNDLGVAVVIVTHDQKIAALCDRQIHVQNGIVSCDPNDSPIGISPPSGASRIGPRSVP